MKKFLAVILALTMALSLIGCSGGTASNKQAIVGTWKAVDTESETEYGLGIEFTKDGKLRYGLTEDVLNSLTTHPTRPLNFQAKIFSRTR